MPGHRSPEAACDALRMAVRAYAVRVKQERSEDDQPSERRRLKRRLPREVLVFDTETMQEPAQRLLVGSWRLYTDRWDGEPGVTCKEEGFFYPDDLPERRPREFALLNRYCRENEADVAPAYRRIDPDGHRIRLWPVSRWNDKRLHRYAFNHRDRCHVAGFNLPFDLGRLARYWTPARGRHRGGWSLGLWGDFDAAGTWHDRRWARRLLMKAIDPRRTLFAWGSRTPGEEDIPDWKGFECPLVDLHTLAFALTDRNHTLESACSAFGDPFEKQKVPYGRITERLLDYTRKDVAHTARLYRNCMAELARHEGVELKPHLLYSPATVGTKYLQAMHVPEPMEQFTDLEPRILGWSMSAFFGGRAEARIVRTPVPVALVDATSMYPTVNGLLDTWALLIAEGVEVQDATSRVQALIADPTLSTRLFEQRFWSEEIGVILVELESRSGQILPVRAWWDPEAADPGIGVNPLTYEGRLWYMLPDVLASVLLSEQAPRVNRAIRLVPLGRQPGLRSVKLRGGRDVDPGEVNPFLAMIEERRRIEADASIPKAERDRLSLFLKITANATAYGVLARFDRRELARAVEVTVYGPDEEPTETKTVNPEDPGPYCFPPVAASITAAARLLLAMLEREVTSAGGTYAFCDTDSMAIVATPRGRHVACRTADGRSVHALARRQVEAILMRFDSLNPYAHELVEHLWKVERDSLDRPLTAYAISAKRYAVYRMEKGRRQFARVADTLDEVDTDLAEEGEDTLIDDWSEHGLGQYLDPIDPDDPRRDDQERRLWMREVWEWVLAPLRERRLPAWADTMAVTRFTASSPRVAAWFSGFDVSVHRDERIRPGSFGLLAHPTGFVIGEVPKELARPAAPYEAKPAFWPQPDWYDRRTGKPVVILTADPDTDPATFARGLERGDLPVKALRDVVTEHPQRIEHKSLAPSGVLVTEETKGLLGRRPIASGPVLTDLIGKEGNKLLERVSGEVVDPEDYRVEYGRLGDRWGVLVLPVLKEMGAEEVIGRTGRKRSAVYEVIAGRARPSGSRADAYLRAASEWAEERLRATGIEPSADAWGTLNCYTRERDRVPSSRRCVWCGKPIHPRARAGALYDSDRCRTAARRARLLAQGN